MQYMRNNIVLQYDINLTKLLLLYS